MFDDFVRHFNILFKILHGKDQNVLDSQSTSDVATKIVDFSESCFRKVRKKEVN